MSLHNHINRSREILGEIDGLLGAAHTSLRHSRRTTTSSEDQPKDERLLKKLSRNDLTRSRAGIDSRARSATRTSSANETRRSVTTTAFANDTHWAHPLRNAFPDGPSSEFRNGLDWMISLRSENPRLLPTEGSKTHSSSAITLASQQSATHRLSTPQRRAPHPSHAAALDNGSSSSPASSFVVPPSSHRGSQSMIEERQLQPLQHYVHASPQRHEPTPPQRLRRNESGLSASSSSATLRTPEGGRSSAPVRISIDLLGDDFV